MCLLSGWDVRANYSTSEIISDSNRQKCVLRRPLLARFDSTGRNASGLSVLLFSSSANPQCVTLARSGFSIMIFNTPTLNIRQRYFLKRLSTRKNHFRLSPQRSRQQCVESSGLNAETSPQIMVDGRRWDATLETCQFHHAPHRFLLNGLGLSWIKKSERTCAAVEEKSHALYE